MKLFYVFLLLVSLTLINPSVAVAGEINGSIVMPTPYSQTGDMTLFIKASSDADINIYQAVVVIDSGEAAAGYSENFSITGLMAGIDYVLEYRCSGPSSLEACKKIVPKAFYKATSLAVVRPENATEFSGTNITSGLSFPVIKGKTITGSLSLPSGVAPAGGISFTINARETANLFGSLILSVSNNNIAQGNSSESYEVTIPDDVSESWTIGFECSHVTNCNDYLPFGYRKSSLINGTVEDRADADVLAGNVDSANQDMTLLEGYSISGTINVPSNVTDASGLQVEISVTDNNNLTANFQTNVIIPQGGTSVPYDLTVSLDGSADWIVKYFCQFLASPVDCAPYITQAFYNSSEASNTIVGGSNAETLDGGMSYSNIDMTLLTGRSISGKLQLSDGVAPAGGISFTVFANDIGGVNNNDFTSAVVTMAEGNDEVTYLINVEDNAANSYRVSFNCVETITVICEKLSDQRYYDSTSGNTIDIEGDADPLAGNVTHTDIDLEVLSSALLDELCVPIKTSAGGVAVICL